QIVIEVTLDAARSAERPVGGLRHDVMELILAVLVHQRGDVTDGSRTGDDYRSELLEMPVIARQAREGEQPQDQHQGYYDAECSEQLGLDRQSHRGQLLPGSVVAASM